MIQSKLIHVVQYGALCALLGAICVLLSACCREAWDPLIEMGHETDCDNGNWGGCASLGFQYEKGVLESGRKIPVDLVKAAGYFKKSCDLEPGMCILYARYVEEGRGGEQADPKRALELFEKSCRDGTLSGTACAEAVRLSRTKGLKPYDAKTILKYTKDVCTDPQPETLHLCKERAFLPAPPKVQNATKDTKVATLHLEMKDGATAQAGTGFVAHPASCTHTILVTALQNFGPSGGYTQQIPSTRLAQDVTRVSLHEPITALGKDAVSLPNAHPFGSPERGSGDVAAFRITTEPPPPSLTFSKTPARLGDTVHVWAAQPKQPPTLHQGVVIRLYENRSEFRFVFKTSLDPQGMSGAPVLNKDGEVVGVFSGAAEEQTSSSQSVTMGIAADLRGFGQTIESTVCRVP